MSDRPLFLGCETDSKSLAKKCSARSCAGRFLCLITMMTTTTSAAAAATAAVTRMANWNRPSLLLRSSSKFSWSSHSRNHTGALTAVSRRTTVSSSSSSVATVSLASGWSQQQQQQQQKPLHPSTASTWLAAGALLTGLFYQNGRQQRADCCGIAGVVATPNHDARYVRLVGCWLLVVSWSNQSLTQSRTP